MKSNRRRVCRGLDPHPVERGGSIPPHPARSAHSFFVFELNPRFSARLSKTHVSLPLE